MQIHFERGSRYKDCALFNFSPDVQRATGRCGNLAVVYDQHVLNVLVDEVTQNIFAGIRVSFALTIDDVISRRTRLAFEAEDHGVHLANEVGILIAPLLGWSAKERKESCAAYEALVDRELAALHELLGAKP